MFSFKVYTDSDSYIPCRNEAQALKIFNDRISKGLFALLVEEVGNSYVCQTVWFEGAQHYNESQFENLLRSL